MGYPHSTPRRRLLHLPEHRGSCNITDLIFNRWAQPDTYVPESQGVQAWDRYAYVNNSPINYNDPTGHAAECGYNGDHCGADYGPKEPVEIVQAPPDAVDNIWAVTEFATSFISEPLDWFQTGAHCVQGDCSPWILLGIAPLIPGSVGDDIGEGLIRLVRKDQIGTSQPFKLRKGEDGLSVFEGVLPDEVLDVFPGGEVPNTTVTIPKDMLPPGTQVISKLDPGLPQLLSEAHRILVRPEGWSIDRFAKALKELVGWK